MSRTVSRDISRNVSKDGVRSSRWDQKERSSEAIKSYPSGGKFVIPKISSGRRKSSPVSVVHVKTVVASPKWRSELKATVCQLVCFNRSGANTANGDRYGEPVRVGTLVFWAMFTWRLMARELTIVATDKFLKLINEATVLDTSKWTVLTFFKRLNSFMLNIERLYVKVVTDVL